MKQSFEPERKNESETPQSEPDGRANSEQIAWGRVLCYKLRQC